MSIKLRLLAEQGGGGVWPQLNFPYIKKIFEKFSLSLSREGGGSGLAELFYMKKKLFWAEPLGGGGGVREVQPKVLTLSTFFILMAPLTGSHLIEPILWIIANLQFSELSQEQNGEYILGLSQQGHSYPPKQHLHISSSLHDIECLHQS